MDVMGWNDRMLTCIVLRLTPAESSLKMNTRIL